MANKPQESANNLTAQAYAAIHLRVPDSGADWLDQMIRKSRDQEYTVVSLDENRPVSEQLRERLDEQGDSPEKVGGSGGDE